MIDPKTPNFQNVFETNLVSNRCDIYMKAYDTNYPSKQSKISKLVCETIPSFDEWINPAIYIKG